MSQHEEDGLVRDLFPEGFVGNAVEVGAGDGVLLSNTIWMEQAGWRVLCVEPNPSLFSKLKGNRKLVAQCACLDYCGESELLTFDLPGSAHHGMLSVTRYPSPLFMSKFAFTRKGAGTIGKTTAMTLDGLLSIFDFPSADFVSVDVDGAEMMVLRGFSVDKWKTRVVLVENPFESHELVGWFTDRKFKRVHRRIGGLNDIYVREDP